MKKTDDVLKHLTLITPVCLDVSQSQLPVGLRGALSVRGIDISFRLSSHPALAEMRGSSRAGRQGLRFRNVLIIAVGVVV